MLPYFLSDIFCTPSLDAAGQPRPEDVIDMETGTLQYNKLVQHPVVQLNLRFVWLFKDVFGTNPSKLHLWEYAQAHGTGVTPTLATLARVLVQRHGLLKALPVLMQSQSVDLVTQERAARYNSFCYSLLNNPAFVKSQLLQLVQDRTEVAGGEGDVKDQQPNKDASLYMRYKGLFSDMGCTPQQYYQGQARAVEEQRLLQACTLTGCPVPTPQTSMYNLTKAAITLLDALRYAVHTNTYLLRVLLQKTAGTVCVARDVGLVRGEAVARQVARRHGKHCLLLTVAPMLEGAWHSPHAATLAQRCLPTQFDLQGTAHASTHRPLLFVDDAFLSAQLGVAPYCHASMAAKAVDDRLTGAHLHTRHIYGMYSKALERAPAAVPAAALCQRAVVLIDNRPNPLSVAACIVTLSNLDRGSWALVVYTTPAAASYYRELLPTGTDVRDTQLGRLTSVDLDAFTIEDYNAIMKGRELWQDLHDLGARAVLTVQDDGMIVRPGLEKEFFEPANTSLKFDYVGAPWAQAPDNVPLATLANPQMVGNGGVSLRNVPMHLAIAQECSAQDKLRLFFHDMQPVPEDVFFAGEVHRRGGRIPSREQAQLFSSEQVLHPNSFAFHKLWAYHSPANVDAFFAGCSA